MFIFLQCRQQKIKWRDSNDKILEVEFLTHHIIGTKQKYSHVDQAINRHNSYTSVSRIDFEKSVNAFHSISFFVQRRQQKIKWDSNNEILEVKFRTHIIGTKSKYFYVDLATNRCNPHVSKIDFEKSINVFHSILISVHFFYSVDNKK